MNITQKGQRNLKKKKKKRPIKLISEFDQGCQIQYQKKSIVFPYTNEKSKVEIKSTMYNRIKKYKLKKNLKTCTSKTSKCC